MGKTGGSPQQDRGHEDRSRSGSRRVERRRSQRAPAVVRVDYTAVDTFFSEFSRNINEGGLFIETEHPHPPGTQISLQFHIPGSEDPVKAQGRVAWSTGEGRGTPPGMGIEFEELDPSARERVNELIRRLRVG